MLFSIALQTGETLQIRDLLRTLYEAACSKKNWGIVRHTAGFLGKKVEDLSKSVTDLLVRQKQVSYQNQVAKLRVHWIPRQEWRASQIPKTLNCHRMELGFLFLQLCIRLLAY